MLHSKVKLRDFDPAIGLDRGAGKLKEASWYLVKIFFFLTPFPFPSSLKAWLLKVFGAQVGERITIKPRVNIHMPWKLVMGDDVWLGEEVFLLNLEKVRVGSNVTISQRAFVCCGNHDFTHPSMPYRNAPITLEDGCWVGAGCFVGPGVTIGIDTVVTAGSVVVSSLLSNSIYSGNPVQFKKPRWPETGSPH
jgi:putative colanic acid biosynthesis acetyltransferase WcaF